MPLVINTNITGNYAISAGQMRSSLQKIVDRQIPAQLERTSEGVSSQIREQALSNQGAARRILDNGAAKNYLSGALAEIARESGMARMVQARGNLIDISGMLLD